MRQIVIELGKLTLPFYNEKSGKQRFKIIKKENPDTSEQKDRRKLTDEIPSVKFLRYEPDSESGEIFAFETGKPFFRDLNYELLESRNAADYPIRFARKLKKKNNYWIRVYATDDEMVLKLIQFMMYVAFLL